MAVIWAQTGPGARRRACAASWCPCRTPGVEVRPIERKLSLRISYSGEIFLRDVELPAEAVAAGRERASARPWPA